MQGQDIGIYRDGPAAAISATLITTGDSDQEQAIKKATESSGFETRIR